MDSLWRQWISHATDSVTVFGILGKMNIGLMIDFALVGGAALGAAIAILAIFFLNRFDKFDARILGSVASVLAGGTVTSFLAFTGVGAAEKLSAWTGYGVGLGLVMLLAARTGHLDLGGARNKQGQDHLSTIDPRIVTLDALRERYNRNELTFTEFERAKEAILVDLSKTPSHKATEED